MVNIKVKSTVYPTEPISEKQWLKEFNVGQRLKNPINGFGFTYGEYLDYIRKTEKTDRRGSSNLVGTIFK